MTVTSNIHVGLAAWQASHVYNTLNVRVSNGGNAYQLIGTGTSAGSGGPSGTGASITDSTCTWQYLSHIDFTTIPSWIGSIPVTLGQPYIGQLWNDGPITTTVGTKFFDLTGHTTSSTNTITLTCAPGESICDVLANQTTPLAFNANLGVNFQFPQGVGVVDYITIEDSFVIIKGLQFQDTYAAGSQSAIMQINTPSTNVTVTNCLFDAYGQGGGANHLGANSANFFTISNCVFIDRASVGTGGNTFDNFNSTNTHFANCTFVATTGNISGTAVQMPSTQAGSQCTNCIFVGYAAPFLTGGSADTITLNFCLTDVSSFGTGITLGSGNQTSRAAANQFVNAASDWRLKSGSNCIGTGTVDTADVPAGTDLVGTVRGSVWDIGAWEFLTAVSASGVNRILALSASISVQNRVISASAINTISVPAAIGSAAQNNLCGTNFQISLASTGVDSSSVSLSWTYLDLVPFENVVISATAINGTLQPDPCATAYQVALGVTGSDSTSVSLAWSYVGAVSMFGIAGSGQVFPGNVVSTRSNVLPLTSRATVINPLGAMIARNTILPIASVVSVITRQLVQGSNSILFNSSASLSQSDPISTNYQVVLSGSNIFTSITLNWTYGPSVIFDAAVARSTATLQTFASATQTIEQLTANAIANFSIPATATQSINYTAIGRVAQATVSGIGTITFSAAATVAMPTAFVSRNTLTYSANGTAIQVATPTITFRAAGQLGQSNGITAVNPIRITAVGQLRQANGASATNTLTIVSGAATVLLQNVISSTNTILALRTSAVLGNFSITSRNNINFTANVDMRGQNAVRALATFFVINIFVPQTLAIQTEDLQSITTENRMLIKSDASFLNAAPATQATCVGTFPIFATAVADQRVAMTATSNIDLVSNINTTLENVIVSRSRFDITANGMIATPIRAAVSFMNLSVKLIEAKTILTDPFGFVLLEDPRLLPSVTQVQLVTATPSSLSFAWTASGPPPPILAIQTDVSQSQAAQSNVVSGLVAVGPLLTAATAMVSTVANLTANIDIQAVANLGQSDPVRAVSSVTVTSAAIANQQNIASALGTILRMDAHGALDYTAATNNIDFTAAGTAVLTTSVTCTATILSLASSATAVQLTATTAVNNIDVSAAGTATQGLIATGVGNIDFSVTSIAELNGSVFFATSNIDFVAIGALLQDAGATALAELEMIVATSAHLWQTPPEYVEGDQMVYWPD